MTHGMARYIIEVQRNDNPNVKAKLYGMWSDGNSVFPKHMTEIENWLRNDQTEWSVVNITQSKRFSHTQLDAQYSSPNHIYPNSIKAAQTGLNAIRTESEILQMQQLAEEKRLEEIRIAEEERLAFIESEKQRLIEEQAQRIAAIQQRASEILNETSPVNVSNHESPTPNNDNIIPVAYADSGVSETTQNRQIGNYAGIAIIGVVGVWALSRGSNKKLSQ